MNIQNLPLEWYIQELEQNRPFSLAHYGDGEWLAVFKDRLNGQNAEGTVYTNPLCDELLQTLRYKADNFHFATPDDLKHVGIVEPIDAFLKAQGLDIVFLEKDVWNASVRDGVLGPFIKAVRGLNLCFVSNEAMRGLYFLNYRSFVDVGYPNAYERIDQAVEEALKADAEVYIVAMGLAGPCFVRRMHEKVGDKAFIIEVGSIFDGFVGMGGQRGWRAEMYADPRKVMAWRTKNLANL